MKKRPEKLSATLAKLLASRGWTSRLREYRVVGKWERIVGDVIALHSRPAALRGKKLTVAVDSPAWMQQLTLLKPELLEKLNRHLGEGAVASIVLKIGEVSAPARPPDKQPLSGMSGSLTQGERARIEDYIKDLADPAVREALRHVMEKDFQSRKKTTAGKGAKK